MTPAETRNGQPGGKAGGPGDTAGASKGPGQTGRPSAEPEGGDQDREESRERIPEEAGERAWDMAGERPGVRAEQAGEPGEPLHAGEWRARAAGWQAKAEEHYNQFLRARADYENLLRRTQREVALLLRLGKRDLFLKLLELADNLERAVCSWQESLQGVENLDAGALTGGVEMIGRQLQAILAAEGVKPVESVGQPFDPAVHEAVAAWESPDVEQDTVTDEIRKGYTHQGELLRAAQVRVARPAR